MAVAKVDVSGGGKQLFIYIFSTAQSQVIKENEFSPRLRQLIFNNESPAIYSTCFRERISVGT
jgi:hypothetical protein